MEWADDHDSLPSDAAVRGSGEPGTVRRDLRGGAREPAGDQHRCVRRHPREERADGSGGRHGPGRWRLRAAVDPGRDDQQLERDEPAGAGARREHAVGGGREGCRGQAQGAAGQPAVGSGGVDRRRLAPLSGDRRPGLPAERLRRGHEHPRPPRASRGLRPRPALRPVHRSVVLQRRRLRFPGADGGRRRVAGEREYVVPRCRLGHVPEHQRAVPRGLHARRRHGGHARPAGRAATAPRQRPSSSRSTNTSGTRGPEATTTRSLPTGRRAPTRKARGWRSPCSSGSPTAHRPVP